MGACTLLCKYLMLKMIKLAFNFNLIAYDRFIEIELHCAIINSFLDFYIYFCSITTVSYVLSFFTSNTALYFVQYLNA